MCYKRIMDKVFWVACVLLLYLPLSAGCWWIPFMVLWTQDRPFIWWRMVQNGCHTQLHLKVQKVIPGIFEEQILSKKQKPSKLMCYTIKKCRQLSINYRKWPVLRHFIYHEKLQHHGPTSSRSMVARLQSSWQMLGALVCSRAATSRATWRRAFPRGCSRMPTVINIALFCGEKNQNWSKLVIKDADFCFNLYTKIVQQS